MISDKALLEQFINTIWLERGLSQNTADSYRNDMNRLVQWMEKNALSLLTVTTEELQDFQAWLVDKDYKQTSRARMLSAIRRFFQYLIQEKLRSDDCRQIWSRRARPALRTICGTAGLPATPRSTLRSYGSAMTRTSPSD